MSTYRTRIEWIDIAKGITIILVVLGHSIQSYGRDLGLVFRIIYSFHMPAFFVISGLTFTWDTKFIDFVKKKARTLLIPYCFFAAVTFLYNILVALIKGNIYSMVGSLKEKLFYTVTVTSESYFMNLWFLPCLFTALIILYLVFKIFSKDIVRGGVCLILSVVVYVLRSWFGIVLPMCGELAVIASLWIFIGYKLRSHLARANKWTDKIILTVSAVLFGVMNYISILIAPETSDSYRQLLFGNIIVSFFTGLLGSLMLLYLSVVIKKCHLLEKVGRNSNIIYGLHFLLLGSVGALLRHIPFLGSNSIISVFIGTASIVAMVMFLLFIRDKLNSKYVKQTHSDAL